MRSNLLGSLKMQNLQELLSDIESLRDGFKISFVIDTFDLVEFCFPLGLQYDDSTKTIDQIGDEQLAYEFIFTAPGPVDLLVLPEYREELKKMRSVILRQTEGIVNKRNDLHDRFILPITNEEDDTKKGEQLKDLEKTVSFLISYAMMADQGVERFTNLINNKVAFTADDINNNADIIYNLPPELVERYAAKALEEWVETNKDNLNNLQTQSEKLELIESVYRDIKVIVKTMLANKHLADIGAKHLLLYHSSTPERSSSIFALKTICSIDSTSNQPNISILRTKKQTFLLALITTWNDLLSKEPGTLNELTKKIYNISEIQSTYETYLASALPSSMDKKARSQLYKKLSQELFSTFREKFEKDSLLEKIHQYNEYRNRIQEQIKTLQTQGNKNYDVIISIYNKYLYEAKTQTSKVSTNLSIGTTKLAYSIQLNISYIIKKLLTSQRIEVVKGRDVIRGTFHHLPLLLFYRNDEYIDVQGKRILQPLIDFCLLPPNQRQIQVQDFFTLLNSYIKFSKNENSNNPTLILVSMLLLLLVPSTGKTKQLNDDHDKEQTLLDQTRDLMPVFEQYNKEVNQSTDHYKELLYVLCWLHRRCRKFNESLSLAEEGINKYRNDPRFFHGKAVSLYAEFFDTGKKGTLPMINKIIETSLEALEKYNATRGSYYQYAVAALHNQICHLYTIKYEVSKDEADIFEAKRHLNYLEQFFNGLSIKFDDYPELLQTKAQFELNETRELISIGRIEQALTILDSARTNCELAIQIAPDYELAKTSLYEIKNVYDMVKASIIKGTKTLQFKTGE